MGFLVDLLEFLADPASAVGLGAADILGHHLGDPDANRSYHISLTNSTPFNLKLIDSKDSVGEWEKAPPKEIGSRKTEDFKMKASGYREGVSGFVSYQIEDKEGFFDPDSHAGKEGCLRLDWNNPYHGVPNTSKSFGECPDILGSGDPSSDYKLGISKRGQYSEEEEWTDWVAISIPFDWIPFIGRGGYTANPYIELLLQPRSEPSRSALTKVPFGGGFYAESLPKIPSLKFIPMNGGISKAWVGIWTTALANEPSDIVVKIQKGPFIESTITNENDATTNRFIIPTFEQSYVIDLTDKFASICMHEENVIMSPLIMPPYKGEMLKKDDGRVILNIVKTPSLPFPLTTITMDPTDGELNKHIPVVETKVSDDGDMRITGVKVDTLSLPKNIYLQLFKSVDPSKYFVGFRVRYLRTTDDGMPLEDVMLREYHPIK